MGCSSISVLLVNAEIDSMGGVVEGGVDVACKASPQRAAIEKVQAELRQEYSVRDKRKRELEFLEKGGNPLDLLKPGNAAAVSVQSTSFTSQHPEQFITSEAKGSFAFTASPHGDSVESSGRLGANPCEPNSADNLMLFDAEPEFSRGDKGSLHPTTNKIVPSEKLFQLDGIHSTREHRDSAAFSLPRKAYKRRNRSRPNREGTRSSSTDVNHARGSHGSSLPSRHGKELKSLISDNQSIPINCISEPTCPTDGTLHKTGLTNNQQDMELDGGKAVESTKNLHEGVAVEAGSDAIASDTPLAGQCIQQSDPVTVKTPTEMSSNKIKAKLATEEMAAAEPAINEYQPTGPANNVENQSTSCQINGVSSKKEGIKHDAYKTNTSRGMKGLDSESPCNQNRINIDESNAGEMLTKMRNADSNGKIDDQTLVPDGMPLVDSDEFVERKRETGVVDSCTLNNTECGCKLQPEDELNRSGSAMKDVVIGQFDIERTEACKPSGFESGKKPDHTLDDNLGPNNEKDLINTSISNFPEDGSLTRMSTVSFEVQNSPCCPKLEVEIDDDSILKEAQIIEAKRKRIAELCVATYPRQLRPKSHWDYVLEEMAWLANDFAQERVWKMAAAAQISFRAASSGCLRQQENISKAQAKKIAHTLAKSVMGFWHSVEETSRVLEEESRRDDTSSVKAYAVRFLKHNTSNVILGKAEEVSSISDVVSDMEILDLSWEDNLTEENLFYTVPPGAIEAYRISIESHVAQCERIGSSLQEEVETSACDAMADFESQDTAYDEDEGETNTHDMTFEVGRSTGYVQKKQKHLIRGYGETSCEVYSDTLQMPYVENKAVTQQSALLAKRPGGSFNVSIPTKRVRTASRRIISPFSAGTTGCIQVPNKTDASSGDTNSFQDDQTTLRGGSLAPHCLEVESAGAFDKQLSFDSAEGVTKHKKKKKAKHLNAAYDPRWQAGSNFQMEQYQRDKKRSHQFDSNGGNGLFGQPVTKKPKIMRQSQDNFFENIAAIGGSAPSPVASQMSNMSNPNKFIKMFGGRDRGRKPKVLKMPGGQSGSGSPWTLFEDQALVVLAHDLGPNWELVSDAINSTLQFKCIFRKAKECKERHNFLMDRTSGDGADSAEDSGSSQPYPSTLPGIPKGSARQLFQRLQGPMEEETLKTHFEKIIIIGQKLQYRKTQNDKQDPKQLQQPHSSHTVALSQVSPNNLNGGPVLTPLDLSDSTIAGPEILPLGYQGQHPGGISNPNQSTVTQMHPASGASSALQGSPNNLMVGNNLSSSPGSLNPSMRDVRYGVPRSASLLADEQQRMQQYNQMITSRNTTQANISSSGALPGSDRGVRILPGGSGMGLASGVNRSIPLAKPGFQGLASSILNPAGMVSPGMSSANIHSGVGTGHGSSMLRPREAIHMMRPGLSQDPQRQMMVPAIQMQVSPGNGQVPHFGGLNSPMPNQTASPPVSYPLRHQPSHPISPHHTHFQGPSNHAPNPQHQAYAMRLAKERQQHRFQGQQPQFAASMPHVQSQPQLPLSSPSQNSPQVQPQAGSPPVTISPLTSVSSMNSMSQNQQKHQSQTQGVVRAQAAGAGITNHISKQRQRQQQQLSQGSRQHPQQRQQQQQQQQQQPQAQQPAKIVKGVGRGNLIVHQNPSLVNGVSASPGNQGSEKGETATHVIPSQGLYTSPSVNTLPPTRHYMSPHSSNHSLPQPKNYSGQAASSTKHPNQITSHPDSSSLGHVTAVAPGLSTGHQSVSSMAKAGQNFKKAPSHQKLANQNQLAHQRVQQNRQINLDPSNKPQARDSDADQHPTNSSAEMVATTISPQTSNHVANVAQVVSSASTHQWHASEPLVDQNAVSSAVNLSAPESVPSNSGESASQVGPVPDHRPSSSSIPSSKNDVGAQWQQQPSQLQHANSSGLQHQQHQQALHSQQQGQILQTGKGNLYGRSSDQELERD